MKILNRLIAILLIAAIGLFSSLDSPEYLENALQNKYLSSSSQMAIISNSAEALLKGDGDDLKRAKDRKTNCFDEDYVIAWISPSRPRLDLVGINHDVSTTKYRSFYSLGNLSSRHLLLAEYRDFINLNIQQYGRSIH